MYPTQCFIIGQIRFFPTFFHIDQQTILISARTIQSLKYCNTLHFSFKRQNRVKANATLKNMKNDWNE